MRCKERERDANIKQQFLQLTQSPITTLKLRYGDIGTMPNYTTNQQGQKEDIITTDLNASKNVVLGSNM